MSAKITPDHLDRSAVVYVRQSTMSQVMGNLESQRRQYDLAGAAQSAGFIAVTVIDDDLGRSGSGSIHWPGFERLVAMVCSGNVGAVCCIEASRLARNGRDWHHLIDLCALAGALVIDPDGAYDPRLVNDRLLLGLKGTMSEYELQRGIAARDSKARRSEYRFMLPPRFWLIRANVMSPASWKLAGMVHWSMWPNWSRSVTIFAPARRQDLRSTERSYSNLLAICPRLGTRRRPIQPPSSASSTSWCRRSSATSTTPPMRRSC